MTTKKAPSSVPAKKPAASTSSTEPTFDPKAKRGTQTKDGEVTWQKEETAPVGLQIIAMQVENIKKVGFARIRPKGNIVDISGVEGSGKSTILNAIDWALRGMANVPSQPIKLGKNSGKIQVDLGDFKITRTFIRKEGAADGKTFLSELRVEGKDSVYKTPQTVLDGLVRQISFDPLEFINMKRAQQFETLRSMVVFDVDLGAIDKEKQEAYDKRRDVGRDLDRADALVESFPAAELDLPAMAIDTAALTKKLQTAAEENGKAEEARILKESHRTSAKQLRDDSHGYDERVEELKKEIEDLYQASVDAANSAIEMEKTAEAIVVPAMIDTAAVADELRAAQDINARIRARDARKGAEDAAATYREEWNALDATVKAKEKERADALARAKMPLPGLEIGAGEVIYNKLPFDQASHSEQIRVSVALAMASSPKLRVMCIHDGTILQEHSMKIITEMCAGQNYQLWIERVDGSGPAAVVMADGEASGEDVEVVK